MARTVQILGRTYLPGPGFNTSGNPKQGKIMTWGRINVSSYTTGGEALVPNDVGLTTIDNITFNAEKVGAAGVTAPTVAAGGVWDGVNQKVLLFTGGSQVTSTHQPVVGFTAYGDSARDVESLA